MTPLRHMHTMILQLLSLFFNSGVLSRVPVLAVVLYHRWNLSVSLEINTMTEVQ